MYCEKRIRAWLWKGVIMIVMVALMGAYGMTSQTKVEKIQDEIHYVRSHLNR